MHTILTISLCVEEDEQGKKYNCHGELELVSMSFKPGGKYVTHQQVAEAV